MTCQRMDGSASRSHSVTELEVSTWAKLAPGRVQDARLRAGTNRHVPLQEPIGADPSVSQPRSGLMALLAALGQCPVWWPVGSPTRTRNLNVRTRCSFPSSSELTWPVVAVIASPEGHHGLGRLGSSAEKMPTQQLPRPPGGGKPQCRGDQAESASCSSFFNFVCCSWPGISEKYPVVPLKASAALYGLPSITPVQ